MKKVIKIQWILILVLCLLQFWNMYRINRIERLLFIKGAPSFSDLMASKNSKSIKSWDGEENPTDYINEIIQSSEHYVSRSSTDPQIQALISLGSDNVSVLLEALANMNDYGSNYYIMSALKKLVTGEHKDLIISHLSENVELADLIKKFQWEESAEEILVEGLKNEQAYLPESWLLCVAQLEKEPYEILMLEFIQQGMNKATLFKTIEPFLTISTDQYLEQIWQNLDFEDTYEVTRFSELMAEKGSVDALEYLIRTIDDDDLGSKKKFLLKFTTVVGRKKEFKKWFRTNRKHIVWNKSQRKFLVND
jgi:hypothetical protein